eukprot:GHRQ01028714.1.p2 GENE.GHRQ01028714.1~~GHRQ01028714.1.p2  ORF type:complete len:101 (+),score=18.98 GHRQ01028714.1:91-393(+)
MCPAACNKMLSNPVMSLRRHRTCSGQGSNQSITVLLTSPGKFLQRLRRASPTGLMASTTCKLARHFSMYAAQHASLLSGRPLAVRSLRMELISPSFSASL